MILYWKHFKAIFHDIKLDIFACIMRNFESDIRVIFFSKLIIFHFIMYKLIDRRKCNAVIILRWPD